MMKWSMAGLALLLASPGAAQEQAWRVGTERAELRVAGISLPVKAGVLALTDAGEFSHKGAKLDNVAQYKSADGGIEGTAYIYRATWADPALAAYATDRAVHARFGPGVRLVGQSVVALGGRPDAALRLIYADAHLGSSPPLATTAAFASVNGWLVKLRVSGPAPRAAEVSAALDTLLAGATLDRGAQVRPVQPLAFEAPCPVIAASGAQPVAGDDSLDAQALIGMLFGARGAKKPKVKADKPVRYAFPANGETRACVRGTVRLPSGQVDLIQPSGVAEPDTVLGVLNDAGAILAIEKAPIEGGYTLRAYDIGQVDQLGRVTELPSPAEIQAWFDSGTSPVLRVRSRTVYAADGTSTVKLPGGVEAHATVK